MKSEDINWDEAPEGTTHFFTGEFLVVKWHKLEDGIWSYYNDSGLPRSRYKGWRNYSSDKQGEIKEEFKKGRLLPRYPSAHEVSGLAELNNYPWVIPYQDLQDRKEILRLIRDSGVGYQIHDSPNGTGSIFSSDSRYGSMPVTLNLKREAYLEIVDMPTKGEIEERIESAKTKLKQLEAMNEKQLGRI